MKKSNIIIISVNIILIAFFVLLHLYSPFQDVSIRLNQCKQLNNSWEVKVEDKFNGIKSLSFDLKLPKNTEWSIECNLPDDFNQTSVICFQTGYCDVTAYLNGQQIYIYRDIGNNTFLHTSGSLLNFVDIPYDSAGKALKICYSSESARYSGYTEPIFYGTKESVVLHLIRTMIPELLSSIGIIVVSLISIILAIISFKNDKKSSMTFMYIATFALITAVWSLTQLEIIPLIIGNAQISYYVNYLSLYMLCFGYNGYIYCKSTIGLKKVFPLLNSGWAIFTVISYILEILNIVQMHETVLFAHILIGLNAAFIIIFTVLEFIKQRRQAISIVLPTVVLMIVSLFEVITFYTQRFSTNLHILPIGTFIFVLIMITYTLINYETVKSGSVRMKLELELANIDIMTGAPNRNAFENDCASIGKNKNKLLNLTVAMFDMNYLKLINDTFGHEAGDEALKICYKVISESLGGNNKVYRIGGDEFACLAYEDISDKLKLVNNIINKQNSKYNITIAYGTATYDSKIDSDIDDIKKRADHKMYEYKRLSHNNEEIR